MKKHAFVILVGIALLFGSSSIFAGGKSDNAKSVGGTVKVLGVWGGQELDTFNEAIKPFTDRTGIKVDFEGTRDIDAVLTTRVQGNNPPDIALLPGPGKMIELVNANKLVDLSTMLDMNAFAKNYNVGWKDLGSVNGKLYCIYLGASVKGLIWYNPKTLKSLGITDTPKTWADMLVVSKKIASGGIAPWSIGIESGAASGWAGTDWLEDLFLRMYGPAVYKDWYNGKLAWTDPRVKAVWLEWGKIVADPAMVYGGKAYVTSTNFGAAGNPLFATPPKAVFHHQASFITSFFTDQNPGVKAGVDYDFFAFPAVDPKFADAVEGGGNVCAAFSNTPQSKALMEYMASAEFQRYFAKNVGWLATNKTVPLSLYADDQIRRAADILNKSNVYFDASDMMKAEVNTAFWSGVVSYVNNPADLDKILATIEKVRLDSNK